MLPENTALESEFILNWIVFTVPVVLPPLLLLPLCNTNFMFARMSYNSVASIAD